MGDKAAQAHAPHPLLQPTLTALPHRTFAGDATKYFHEFDTDGNGKLSVDEIQRCAAAYGKDIRAQWSKANIIEILKKHQDEDGELTEKEWIAALPDLFRIDGAKKMISPELDDYQSPVTPTRYIMLRIRPMLQFYKRRLPMNTRRTIAFKMFVTVLSTGSSILAHIQLASIVVLVTSLATAVTTWIEFADYERKAERYTRAIGALQDLLDWWDALTEVEQQGKANINNLVKTAEGIFNEEQEAWTSTAASAEKEVDKDNSGGSTDEISGKGGRKREGGGFDKVAPGM